MLFLEAPELQREHRNVICSPQAPEAEKHILCLIPVNFPHLHEITIFSLFFTFIGVILKYVNNVFLSTFTAGNVLHIKLRSQSNILNFQKFFHSNVKIGAYLLQHSNLHYFTPVFVSKISIRNGNIASCSLTYD